LPPATIAARIEGESFHGEFDPTALREAIKAITDDVRSTISAKDPKTLSIDVRISGMNEVAIEWQGGNLAARTGLLTRTNGCGTIHAELATKIIEAHGGTVTCDKDVFRVTLPLSKT
jgi:hypothetical protein